MITRTIGHLIHLDFDSLTDWQTDIDCVTKECLRNNQNVFPGKEFNLLLPGTENYTIVKESDSPVQKFLSYGVLPTSLLLLSTVILILLSTAILHSLIKGTLTEYFHFCFCCQGRNYNGGGVEDHPLFALCLGLQASWLALTLYLIIWGSLWLFLVHIWPYFHPEWP